MHIRRHLLQYKTEFVTTRLAITGKRADAIARSIEQALRDGKLGNGDALPTVRALADQLGVSPTTVSAAYRLLRQRGLVAARSRRGTRVARRASLAQRLPIPIARGARNVADGNPDPALLPDLQPVLARLSVAQSLYGEPCELQELLRVARKALDGDGIAPAPIAIVSGAMDGIDRVLGTQLRSGDSVAVEDPGFAGVLDLVSASGLEMHPMAIDDEGVLPGELGRAIKAGADAVILTPRAHNPTGAALSAARAVALRRVLAAHPGVLLIEDDHAAGVAGAPLHAVCSGRRGRWAYLRSVSKSLGPDLRVAVLTGSDDVVARAQARQVLGMRWVSRLLQAVVAELWADRAVAAQVREAEREYTRRRRALVAALGARGVAACGNSGLNVWIPVREEAAVVQRLAEQGWSVAPGERFRLVSNPGIRVSVSRIARPQVEALADAVAGALSTTAGRAGRSVQV